MTDQTNPAPKRPRRMAREPQIESITRTATPTGTVSTRSQTKTSLVEGLLLKGDGASLADLCQATGWLPHTCRAFLTGLRKKGRQLARDKREDGTTIYRLAALKVHA